MVPAVGPLPAWLPSVSDGEVSKRAHYALNCLQQACADKEKKIQKSKGKVGLSFGKGMLSVAARSSPDRVMAVPVPFTPQLPASRIGGKGKGYAENQACDKGKAKVEFVEGLAQDTVVSSPCTPKN